MVSLALMLGLGCGKDTASLGGNNHNNTARVSVKVDPARLGEIRTTIQVAGTVKAAQEAKLGTKVSGRVQRVNVDEGDRVKQGEALVGGAVTRLRPILITSLTTILSRGPKHSRQILSGLGAQQISAPLLLTTFWPDYHLGRNRSPTPSGMTT